MVSLLYVHAKRTGWKIRTWRKTVIIKIKMIQMKSQYTDTVHSILASHFWRSPCDARHLAG